MARSRKVKWYHFWNPESGQIGNLLLFIFVMILMVLVLSLKNL